MERRGKANLEDIARATGVSKMTVSRVLRGASGFSDDTRDKVMRAADALGYVPNRWRSPSARSRLPPSSASACRG